MLHLHTLWFIALAILWVGFFVLEGFDFGVGMLHMFTGKNDTEQRVALNAIGPFWDGNEVWLIVAGAGTFAAFPDWYATWFSALYLALLLVLMALIARGVSFEYRGKNEDPAWRKRWSWATTVGSFLIPLLLGVGIGDLLTGLPIDKNQEFTGNFFDLLRPYGLWVGLTLVGLCLLHGCTFLKLKTTGPVRDRARAAAKPIGWIALALAFGFVIWTRAVVGHTQVPSPVEALALIATGFAARLAVSDEHDGWAFATSAVAIASVVGSIFIDLYPNVMVSTTNHAYNLTVSNSASGGYALKVMTIVTVLFLPVVLVYQGWSFHVFRGRVTGPPASPQPPTTEQPPAS
jgi:cytochrome bd ubiquinol oxidase subunit II